MLMCIRELQKFLHLLEKYIVNAYFMHGIGSGIGLGREE